MRPRNLRLQGFTCFRDAVEIDFTGMDVFVIAGPTGAGKTTLVDAICYALYGKVPRGTKIGDLIARDVTEMSVQLEFESGAQRYRVHRAHNVTRTTNKKGEEKVTPALSPKQFERWTSIGWEPLEDRVDQIDEAIENAVGLDFDSFTKCVLLPQGRFAEFLTGEVKERRRILTELLGTGVYELIMRRANGRAAVLQTQIGESERRLREDYANATDEALAATRAGLTDARPLLDVERQRRDALQQATELASTVVGARRREHEHTQQLEAKRESLQSARAAAEDGAKTLDELAGALRSAERELARTTFESDLHAALVRAEACAKQVERARLAAERAAVVSTDRAGVDAAEAAAGDAEARHAEAREAVAEAERVLREAERADAAAHLRAGLKRGDACPVCGGIVGTLSKTAGKSSLTAAERGLDAARLAEKKAQGAASGAATALARAQQAFEQATRVAKEAQDELSRVETELRDLVPAGVEPALDAIAGRLKEQEQARAAYNALAKNVEQARVALDEHRQAIAGSERQIAALTAEIAQLDAAIGADVQERSDALAELKDVVSTWEWDDVAALIDSAKSPVDLLKEMLARSQRAVEEITARIATLERDEAHIAEAIERAEELRLELARMKERYQLCRELGVLLQANNFQQFVVLEAMQVLAQAATEHLKTLFDRFAVRVDGSEFAVVDHWQADQVRPAKTLSGGETFVASLALALALAERLPELRSAAASSLESLFLDEGFGTLDAETLETVIDALEGLRSQERMVGVITHVPELTQRIEHRILVRKSPSGSTVEVAGAVA